MNRNTDPIIRVYRQLLAANKKYYQKFKKIFDVTPLKDRPALLLTGEKPILIRQGQALDCLYAARPRSVLGVLCKLRAAASLYYPDLADDFDVAFAFAACRDADLF